jgi:hypothetical protein
LAKEYVRMEQIIEDYVTGKLQFLNVYKLGKIIEVRLLEVE